MSPAVVADVVALPGRRGKAYGVSTAVFGVVTLGLLVLWPTG